MAELRISTRLNQAAALSLAEKALRECGARNVAIGEGRGCDSREADASPTQQTG